MGSNGMQEDYLLLLKKSLNTIKKLNGDLEKQKRYKEPIAVLGTGFRFPGGSCDPQTFWRFLTEGKDGVIEAPQDRWRMEDLNVPNVHRIEAGFLQENVGEFDAHFFGISPREADEIDPQQRLLLEVSWEALERAGIDPGKLQGTKTGVFVGIIGSDYATLPRTGMTPYTATGSLSNIASGRISYILGVHGPAISIDTACSSSLVAVHLACESLLRGESSLALAGGVNLMLSPFPFISLYSFNALAKDGRCKTFDASGDGYGRGEGCGIVVLKRLSDAVKDKDPILAIIKGTGINQDGPGSGLTVPNGAAQKELILKTLEESNVSPNEISYFEAHGTGTALGDPIEFQALAEVFGKNKDRTEPLIIGSLKSNIGHLEAAAGIAGLIKLVLCLQNKTIPPNLHLKTLNPRINLERIPAIVPQKNTPWEAAGKPRMAGISSFGFSGTNAHAIVAEPPQDTESNQAHDSKPSCERPLHILTLSAKNENALSQLITRYKDYFESQATGTLEDICFTSNTGRSHFSHRVAFTAASTEQMKNRLVEHLHDNPGKGTNEGRGKGNADLKLVFLFNGKADKGIVKALYETQPVFRKMLLSCDERLQQFTNKSFLENILVNDWEEDSSISEYMDDVISFSQQFGMLKLWESWGVKPNAVLGSGMGEFVAACAAGVMDMDTALLFILENRGIKVQADVKKVLNQFRIRMISAAGGGFVEKHEAISGSYWEKVFHAQPKVGIGIQFLIQQGYKYFLEVGPVADPDYQEDIIPNSYFSFPAGDNPWRTLINTLAELYCMGADIDWVGFDRDYRRHKVILPTYPFQRKYFWCEAIPFSDYLPGKKLEKKDEKTSDSFLDGRIINSPVKEKQIEYSLSLDTIPDLKDTYGIIHVGYYMEILYRAVRKIYNKSFCLKSIEFLSALIVPDNRTLDMSLTLLPGRQGELEFSFSSCKGNNNWDKHTQGTVQLNETDPVPTAYSELKTDIISRCNRHCSGGEFYQKLQQRGLVLGKSVQRVENVWFREGEALARLQPPQKPETYNEYEMGVHPGIFDACAQLFHAALPESADESMRYMVTRWEDFSFYGKRQVRELWCHVVLQDILETPGLLKGIFRLFDQDGNLIAQISNGLMKGISKDMENIFKKYIEGGEVKEAENESEILSNLRNAATDKWEEMVISHLQHIFASVFRMEASEISINELLMDLGMDSLMAIEAKASIEKEFGIFLPLELLIQGPSIKELAASIIPLLSIKPSNIDSLKTEDLLPENILGEELKPDYKTDAGCWIAYRKPNPSAKIKLFCFPYGGGGASLYRGWQAKLPDYIEVCPVQLPGRENRIKENAFVDIGTAVGVLKEKILPELDRPYAFYGHSMGALVSYRLAYKLWQEADNKPRHIFVGGYSSPNILPNPFLSSLREKFQKIGYDDIPDPAVISSLTPERVKEINDVLSPGHDVLSQGVDVNEEVVRLLLPLGLAELLLVKSYNSKDKIVFDVPITAIHGQKDDRVKEHEMGKWEELTKGAFKLHIVSGDHFFLREGQNQGQILELVSQVMEKYI